MTQWSCVIHNKPVPARGPRGIIVHHIYLFLLECLYESVFCVRATEYMYLNRSARLKYVSGVHLSFSTLPATVLQSSLLVCLMTSAVCTEAGGDLIFNDRDIPTLWFIWTWLPGKSSVFHAKMVDILRIVKGNVATIESPLSLKSHSTSLSVGTPSSLSRAVSSRGGGA